MNMTPFCVYIDPNGRDELIDTRNQSFTCLDIQRITDSFNTVIGKGGFGTVYYGYIGNNQVAVKMLSESSAQGYREFQAEVHLLMSVHPKNITSLVGYCNEGSQKGIIYEYMANGNLGMHLFAKDLGSTVLSWKKRLEIAYDAAQGLEYMHHGCKPPIVHRDVKCSNILLNENFQAKLADFGLSRAFETESATHVSTVICGTPGYLDPEYYTTNRLTEKSDVYSFGVVLLELIIGRQATSEDILEGGRVGIDLCVSIERPTINDVVMDLKSCLKADKGFHGDKQNKLDSHMALSLESMQGPNLR
ncbi:leucine-rich repeat transmembrane protein kinase protein [Tanacetum coccineum]